MSDAIIFTLGVLVTIMTLIGVVLIGFSEAKDPALNRDESGPADG